MFFVTVICKWLWFWEVIWLLPHIKVLCHLTFDLIELSQWRNKSESFQFRFNLLGQQTTSVHPHIQCDTFPFWPNLLPVIDFDFSWAVRSLASPSDKWKWICPLTIPSAALQQRKRKPKIIEADTEGRCLIKTNDCQLDFSVIGAPCPFLSLGQDLWAWPTPPRDNLKYVKWMLSRPGSLFSGINSLPAPCTCRKDIKFYFYNFLGFGFDFLLYSDLVFCCVGKIKPISEYVLGCGASCCHNSCVFRAALIFSGQSGLVASPCGLHKYFGQLRVPKNLFAEVNATKTRGRTGSALRQICRAQIVWPGQRFSSNGRGVLVGKAREGPNNTQGQAYIVSNAAWQFLIYCNYVTHVTLNWPGQNTTDRRPTRDQCPFGFLWLENTKTDRQARGQGEDEGKASLTIPSRFILRW